MHSVFSVILLTIVQEFINTVMRGLPDGVEARRSSLLKAFNVYFVNMRNSYNILQWPQKSIFS